MICAVCGRSGEETVLLDGIYEGEIVKVCERCAELEEIPLIKKPSEEQLIEADKNYSVRERMERMSRRNIPISKDHETAMKNLAKIQIPEKRQENERLVENYYWLMQMARRRKKLSLSQLSENTNIPAETLQRFERGVIPPDFESLIPVLEEVLDVRLFRTDSKKIIFKVPEKASEERQREILEHVKNKIKETGEREKVKEETIKKIAAGRFDFSSRQNLENVTLSDLIELKRKREGKKAFEKEKREHQEMFGDEIEVEENEE